MNFKTFLRESSDEQLPFLELDVKLHFGSFIETTNFKNGGRTVEQVEEFLKEELTKGGVSAIKSLSVYTSDEPNPAQQNFVVLLNLENNYTASHLVSLRNKAHTILKKLFEAPLNCRSTATVPNLTGFDSFIEFERIRLVFHGANNSMIGIHKKLATETLELRYLNNVQKGGLGLLKVRGLKTIDTNSNTQWVQIIKKALEEKRSVLDTQEELIKNGFKEFARL